MSNDAPGFDTRAIHAGQTRDQFGSVMPAIYQTSIFAFESAAHAASCFEEAESGYVYTRWGNPTTDMLEDCLASLEEGSACLSFATGMAALNFMFYALLESGSHVVVSESIYSPTRLTLDKHWGRFGVELSVVDTYDLDALAAALRPNTKLVHIETPANPNLRITDIAGAARLAHEHGALLSVDSTLASPVLQRPLLHGADIVMHSVTKFLNGHSDVLGGALIFRERALYESLYRPWYIFGASMDPHQAWLVLRGVKTLRPRVLLAQSNAQRIAEWLAAHPAVARVYYPGLADHPGAELHARQADGPGALLSFDLAGGYAAGSRLMDGVRLLTLAASLGGVETLIQHPASMTHHGLTPQQRADAGIGEGMIRLAVGCEDVADLLADLEQALATV